MPELAVALAPWAIIAAVAAVRHSRRVKRGKPTFAMRDQVTPEEREAHFDMLRRKRSDEIKAFKAAGMSR
jgi:hypothetical protein